MALKAWVCRFEGHEIRVVNTWLSGAKLFVDGVCVATDKRLFSISRARPNLTHRFADADGREHLVQVFVIAWMSVQAAIFVDGLQYGGEVLDLADDALRFRTDADRMKALGAGTGSAVAVPASLKL